MPKCESCEKFFNVAKKRQTYYRHDLPSFCSEECFASHIKGMTPIPLDPYIAVPAADDSVWSNAEHYSSRLNKHFRSGYEVVVAEKLVIDYGLDVAYEPYRIDMPGGKYYVPDFFIPSRGLFIEVKGQWLHGSQKKFYNAVTRLPQGSILLLGPGERGWFQKKPWMV